MKNDIKFSIMFALLITAVLGVAFVHATANLAYWLGHVVGTAKQEGDFR